MKTCFVLLGLLACRILVAAGTPADPSSNSPALDKVFPQTPGLVGGLPIKTNFAGYGIISIPPWHPGPHKKVTFQRVEIPQDSGPYPYPLLSGTQAWADADADVRVASTQIPRTWLDRATTWQIFLSAVKNPYFPVMFAGIEGSRADAYNAAMHSAELSILADVEATPDFGSNALRFLESLNITNMNSLLCSVSDKEPCRMHYEVVCDMAGRDAALNTMDQASRQRLFRLAVWDAAYSATSDPIDAIVSADVRLMYAIYNKPESFRGSFPPSVTLPALTDQESYDLNMGILPRELIPSVSAVKSALGLVSRP
jgi:hypothetical protein